MKIKVNRPTEVEITHVTIDVPIQHHEECAEAGGLPFLPFLEPFGADGDFRWKAKIEIETGQILDWPEKAGTRHLFANPVDGGTYRLLGPDGKEVAELVENYVPNLLIPGDYGDYIDLEIDHRGRITNWPKKPDISQFFRDKFDEKAVD